MKQKALPKGQNFTFDYSKQKKLYSYLQAIFMSFYSVNIYVDVRHRWKGFGFLYLLLFSALTMLPCSLYLGYKGNNFYNTVLMPCLDRLPVMNIIDGELQFNEKSPYLIRDLKTKKVLIIIDTSGDIVQLPSEKYPDATVLFTKYTMITKYDKTPADVSKFENDMNGVIDKESLRPFFNNLRMIFLSAIYPNITMLFAALYFTVMAIFAFIMKMFSIILLKYKLSYKEALRLVCVSSTPMLVAYIFVTLFGWQEVVSAQWTLFFIYWGYFTFAVRSNKFAARYPLII